MIRFRTHLVALAVGLAAVFTLAAPASAQVDPYGDPDTPTCTLSVGFSAPALPNALVDVTIGCASIEAGEAYLGSLLSTPVSLPATVATADNTITFQGVRLPADWALNAAHTVTLVEQATGRTLGAGQVCIDRNGRVSTCRPTTGGNIPRTGSNDVQPMLQIGAGLLAAGTVAVVVSRRRRADAAAA